MAGELSLATGVQGQTVEAHVYFGTTRYNGTPGAMVAASSISDTTWDDNIISLTQLASSDATGVGIYVGDMPDTGQTGIHHIVYFVGGAATLNRRHSAIQAYDNRIDDWENGGRLDLILDAILVDTGTTLPATLAGITGALTGDGAFTGTLTINDGSTGLEGAVVHASLGGVLKASGTTDSSGQITNWVFGANTYDLAVRLAGYQPGTDTVAVSADAWSKTISLTAITISSPSAASLCTVSFQVKLSATAVEGAVCKARLLGTNQASDGTILSNAESSGTTGAGGSAELELVRKDSIVKGNGIYKIWIEIDGKPVASVETTIPNQATIYFEDLLRT